MSYVYPIVPKSRKVTRDLKQNEAYVKSGVLVSPYFVLKAPEKFNWEGVHMIHNKTQMPVLQTNTGLPSFLEMQVENTENVRWSKLAFGKERVVAYLTVIFQP
jgi:hypothetical protein